MRIICAPDSFKETLSASLVAQAMAAGAIRADQSVECDIVPIGDGGEGTLDSLMQGCGGATHSRNVCGPRGETVTARYGILPYGEAIVELAEASGLMRVPSHDRDPMLTTTFGTGQLIAHVIDQGCRDITVALGGSATVDGGTGIAQALGGQFFDRLGRQITQPMCGGLLQSIAKVNNPPLPPGLRLRAAFDVTNPLCGRDGAAVVFGPQKGARSPQIQALDAGLANLASIVGGDPNAQGAGAAGGAGFGLMAMCNATLAPGIEFVLDQLSFNDRVIKADLVLTGEGRLDAQSLRGKACIGIARRAVALGVPTIAIVGATGPGAQETLASHGGVLHEYIDLSEKFGVEAALNAPAECIQSVAEQVVRRWKISPAKRWIR